MDDLISRKAAIDWIKGWFDTDKYYHPYSKGKTIPTCEVMDILERVPSAEPCEDAVSREAVSSWLKQYGQDVLHGKMKFSLMYIWKNLMDLPSVQPEIIRCKDCKYQDENWRRVSVRWLPCMDVRTGSNWYCGSAERGEQDDESRSNSNAQADTRARGMGATDKSSGI